MNAQEINFDTNLNVVAQRESSRGENLTKYLGFPLGIIFFLILYLMPTPDGLTLEAQAAIASFALALTWWVTEPIPTYATSLLLMGLLTFFNGWTEDKVLGVFGLEVIWLNILAFILSSTLVKSQLAKRFALWIGLRFGHSSYTILGAFIVLQLFLAPFIPATTARTVMVLPVMLVISSIYGSTSGNGNNFGVNLFMQNLQGISIFSSGFITGSTCNIVAAAFIFEMGNQKVYYSDWMFGMLPITIIVMAISWWLGPKYLFPIKKEDQQPKVKGGFEVMRKMLDEMGGFTVAEGKSAGVFLFVLFLWATDRFHVGWFGFEISAVMAALLGVVFVFLPKIGLLKWNDADIPWHVMIFSAGAYSGGLALFDSGAARWLVGSVFDMVGLGADLSFWTVYIIIIAFSMYAHLFFTSKTMRSIVMIPIIIAIAQQFGFDPVSLALPAAFTLTWVITLPTNAKPNLILYSAGQFSISDNLKYGLTVSTIGVVVMVVAGFTWFRFLGITP
ncbi:MAG: DASS family sodium-coupled anion symporter [Candidatus Marinimicrobia bacterium]|jgi:solute carrier family 13 (sodium-dependent dicarboxylate transporter), member 2/3/5|nr:DASS family sodium-coupled anion symporter [Candidatus Neomarinimicrobiota bacterium]MBT6012432.1 DASS family sodium-coupled anion symporter [Candidatus Neomarinimicrobiota bacterium]